MNAETLIPSNTQSLRGSAIKRTLYVDQHVGNTVTIEARNVDTQQISSANTVKAFDLEYSLDSLQPSSVFSQNTFYFFDKDYIDLPLPSVFEKDYDDELVLASYNNKQEIQSVIVQDKVRRQMVELKSVGNNKLNVVNNNKNAEDTHADNQGLRNMFKTISTISSLIKARAQNQNIMYECTEYDVIDLAIAYDSSYCNELGGKENVEVEIASVISLVTKMYQQHGLCMKVEISYLEGYCDSANDPYQDMLNQNLDSNSLLLEFRKYWNANRQNVHRTVAHLFTAKGMSDDYIGRGYGASICMKASAYSVNQITWNSSFQNKAALIAHELGHNVGADHIDITNSGTSRCISKTGDFIMNSVIGSGTAGFHTASVQSMREVVDKRMCMRKEKL